MQLLFTRVTMRHLQLVSLGIVIFAVLWIVVASLFASDRIWIVPGVFLLITGIIKIVGLAVWNRLGDAESTETR